MQSEPGEQPQEKSDRQLKQAALAAIGEHVRLHGRRDYHLVRERPEFAAVIGEQAGDNGRRKFFRWLKSVTEPTPADKTRPHEGRAIAEEALEDATARAQIAARNLPVAPPPTFFMKMGADAEVKICMDEAFSELWGDLQLVRDQCIETDPSGRQRARAAKSLMASAKGRLEILERALRLKQDISDMEGLHRFYQALIDIIVSEMAEAPAVQARVLQRLQALNEQYAMTPHARDL